MICFDNIYPETARALTLNGAELIFYPTANSSPSELDIETLTRARAIDNCVYVVPCNYGTERVYRPGAWVGRSGVVGLDGLYLADAGRLGGVVVSATVDLDATRWVYGYGTSGINSVKERLWIERRPDIYHVLLAREPKRRLAREAGVPIPEPLGKR